MNNQYRKWIWGLGAILLVGAISSFTYFKVEESYVSAVDKAREAVKVGDFDSAYKAISEKNPKKEDRDMFKKVELITFSKNYLASEYDLNPVMGGDPEYDKIAERLFIGLRRIDEDLHRAAEVNASTELLNVKSEYIGQLESIFGLDNSEIDRISALSDTERQKEIQELARMGDGIAKEQMRLEVEQAQKEANPIEIIDKKGTIRGDYIHVTGAVKNVSQTPHSYIKVKVTHLDNDGDVLDTDWTYASSEDLKPNEQKYFEIMTRYRDGMSKFRVEVESYQWSYALWWTHFREISLRMFEEVYIQM